MDQPSLYDDDIVIWAERQAAAVRDLARRPDLSNMLDWENVAEEIESVGRSQISAVEQKLLLVLIHVLKYMSAPRAQSTRSWRSEVVAFHAAARKAYTPAMRQRIDWAWMWDAARTQADISLRIYDDRLVSGLPEHMPFTPDELVAPTFTMDWALERLAQILNTPKDTH
ncbi:DUF29 domain-containing protein [Methylobacterium sp. WL69]|jgi:hypothetical protein|uniref:DUF29 domain-containing protein n=1 Tax=Methylobacterium sp. WL69 TaxID=2603893 RepID=UPI0011CCDA26|nr:DUF29 domain-containing protein [Methylobacterium sp. WL69]TXM71732.1 DUF29 domain-containing protein [Methylobacterium sp. WL69]